jgi:exosortase/archaeosortase family protein
VSRRTWFIAAVAVALAQLALAVRAGPVTFYGPLALAWSAMLLVTSERRESPILANPPAWIPGALLLLAPFAWLARPEYGPLDRTAALVSGAGLLLLAGGVRDLPRRGRELLLLSLPLISPFPGQIAHAVAPLRGTAVAATLLLRAAGIPAVMNGQDIAFSGTGIAVLESCTGVEQLSQLFALSLVVLCLFRTTAAQKIAVPLLALACGFLANAARVAAIGILARDLPSTVELWDGAGLYAPVFSAVAAALTCLFWWPLLRAAPPRRLPLPDPP